MKTKKKLPLLLPHEITERGAFWVAEHPDAYAEMILIVRKRTENAPKTSIRIRSLIEAIRDKGYPLPNAIQPYLARRLMRDVPGSDITTIHSKIDTPALVEALSRDVSAAIKEVPK